MEWIVGLATVGTGFVLALVRLFVGRRRRRKAEREERQPRSAPPAASREKRDQPAPDDTALLWDAVDQLRRDHTTLRATVASLEEDVRGARRAARASRP